MNPLRRLVLSSATLAPLGCATATFDRGIPVSAPKQMPIVRQPQIGQQWTYLKRDAFTSKVTDVITERVEIVGQRISVARTSQDGTTLSSEIQGLWGSIITVPAGQFTCLRFQNLINFHSDDANKVDCICH